MRQFLIVFLALSLITGLISCDRKKVFEAYHQIDEKGWNKDSVIVFKVHLTDTIKNNNLFVNIRNKGTYAYSNIYLFMTIGSPDGVMRTDTVEFTLADHSGKWRGSRRHDRPALLASRIEGCSQGQHGRWQAGCEYIHHHC